MRLSTQKYKVEISFFKILLSLNWLFFSYDIIKIMKFDTISFYFGFKLNKQFRNCKIHNGTNYVLQIIFIKSYDFN